MESSPGKRYDAVLLAGYGRQTDALSQAAGVTCKALLPIAGLPMIAHILRALAAADCVQRLWIVGLPASELPTTFSDVLVRFVPNQGSLVANMLAAAELLPPDDLALFCSADIPLLTAEALVDIIARCEASGADFCYPIVTRQVMEARFPGSGRSFRNLVDGSFAGGDVYLLRPRTLLANADLARQLTENRKSALGLARALGPAILWRALTHRLRIRDAEACADRLLGCRCRAIVSPYAELAMDVDKPQHLEIVLRAVQERG